MPDPEKVPSAVERYNNEVTRVCAVIDKHLKTTGQEYLVGDKYTYADLSFIPWGAMIPWLKGGDAEKELEKDYPNYWAWWKKIVTRPATEKVLKDKAEAMKGH